MIVERSSSSILRKTISEPQTRIEPATTVNSSMVRALHRSSESCGLDPRLGFRNRFSENRA